MIELNNASYVTIENFTLEGGSYGVWAFGGGNNFVGSKLIATGQSVDGFRFRSDSQITRLSNIAASGSGSYGLYVGGPIGSLSSSVFSDNGNRASISPTRARSQFKT